MRVEGCKARLFVLLRILFLRDDGFLSIFPPIFSIISPWTVGHEFKPLVNLKNWFDWECSRWVPPNECIICFTWPCVWATYLSLASSFWLCCSASFHTLENNNNPIYSVMQSLAGVGAWKFEASFATNTLSSSRARGVGKLASKSIHHCVSCTCHFYHIN